MKKLATATVIACMALFAASASAVPLPHVRHHTYQVVNWANVPGLVQIERNITAHHPRIVFQQCQHYCPAWRAWPVWIEPRNRWKRWGPQPIAYHAFSFADYDPVAWSFGVIRYDPGRVGGRLLRVTEGMLHHPWG